MEFEGICFYGYKIYSLLTIFHRQCRVLCHFAKVVTNGVQEPTLRKTAEKCIVLLGRGSSTHHTDDVFDCGLELFILLIGSHLTILCPPKITCLRINIEVMLRKYVLFMTVPTG